MSIKNLEIIISLWLRDRHFSKTRNTTSQGFTLIELLVVIIIIGILAAIALPSFLSQSQKARFAEAKSYVTTMSRLQQAYYSEKGLFANDVDRLGLGSSSSSYTYTIITGSTSGASTPVQLDRIATNVAEPKGIGIRAFVGVVGIIGLNTSTVLLDTTFCTADSAGTVSSPPGSISGDGLSTQCPTGFSIQNQ
jgi:prepilin-type N-terminal cleavage/methylation domain-containing protein